uniref:t-SNARE coiled-coil homology domain-containing protein n=1 Tax=Globisporangium ultimum (strain ATCC 200006 / CBS 805.95 / DAOM BR144) TaxID=431595 RepID=K3WGQ8_GLOUD
MGDRYQSAQSPRNRALSDEKHQKLVQETSKGISSFNQLTRSMAQKMSLFNTPQDSRANHQSLKELTEKGNKLVTKINRRLQELNKSCQGPQARTRKTQVGKLSNDFKTQMRAFEETCQRLVEMEKNSVEFIRRSSHSFNHNDQNSKVEFANYNEDQIYAQANIVAYDEDDLARREEDIIHINHQLREVNAAFKEIDGLIEDQGEVIVEIEENTENAKENVEKALEQVRQADQKASYCVCTKWKLLCYGGFTVVVLLLVMGIVASMS